MLSRSSSHVLIAILLLTSCAAEPTTAVVTTEDGVATTATSGPATDPPSTTPDVVTLRIGTDDEPGWPSADQIEEFAAQVEELSGGGMQIEAVWNAGGEGNPDWDQVIARMVVGGELDLGLIPARAWDTEGVTSLRALHAPFLVMTDDLLGAVVADPVADEMLAGLEGIGITGLALLPEGIRRVFSFGEPFQSVNDFMGATVRAPTSTTTRATFESLGATTGDFSGEDFSRLVADGTITAAESSFALASRLPDVTATAANVGMYPKANSLVANSRRYAELTDAQRQVLVDAARATRDWAAAGTLAEVEQARRFCDAGGTVTVATDGELAALARQVAPVYAELEADVATRRFIGRIRELAGAVPTRPEFEPCGAPSTGSKPPIPDPPSVVGGTDVTLVVNTQIGAGPSPVMRATGAFEGCTDVVDLDATVTAFSPNIDLFSGEKRIDCSEGSVTIHYDAMADVNQPGVTSGTWSILSSSLAGAGTGGGLVEGAVEGCELLAGSELCILDTFTGTVAG